MFGKKLLSIVSLLFASGQFISFAAGQCTITLTIGNNSPVNDVCAVENCPLGFYAVSADNSDPDTVFNIGTTGAVKKYLKVTGTSTCAEIAAVDDASNCAGGEFESDGGTFCLDDTNTATLNDDKNYLFVDAGDIFGAGANAKIVITSASGSHSFVQKADLDKKDYCVRNGVISEVLDMYCKGDCDYYECNSGVCDDVTIEAREPSTETQNTSLCNPAVAKTGNAATVNVTPSAFHCNAGYYITNSDALFIGNDPGTSEPWTGTKTGTLYHCADAKGTSCESIAGGSAKIGYYKNANAGVDSVKYITCDGTNCNAVFTTPASSCTNNGELIDSSGLKLCTENIFGTKTPITLTTENAVKYFVPVTKSTGTVFDGIAIDGYSIIVEIDKDKAVVSAKASKKYKYTDANNLIYDAAGDAVCSTGVSVYEYVLYKEPSGPADVYDYYSTDGESISIDA